MKMLLGHKTHLWPHIYLAPSVEGKSDNLRSEKDILWWFHTCRLGNVERYDQTKHWLISWQSGIIEHPLTQKNSLIYIEPRRLRSTR